MGAGTTDLSDRDRPTSSGNDPAEGEPKMEFPGPNTELPADRNDDLPERLGERIDPGPDLLPDVEPPAHHM